MPREPSSNKLKILLWEVVADVYISREMLDDKSVYGETSEGKIVINPSIKTLKELIDTGIHEFLHVALPDASENEIQKYTKKIMKSMTQAEKVHILLKLAKSTKRVDI